MPPSLNFWTPARRPSQHEVNFTSRFFVFRLGQHLSKQLQHNSRVAAVVNSLEWSNGGGRRDAGMGIEQFRELL